MSFLDAIACVISRTTHALIVITSISRYDRRSNLFTKFFMTLTFNGCLVAEIPPSVDTRLKGVWTSLPQGLEGDVCQPQYVRFGKDVNLYL